MNVNSTRLKIPDENERNERSRKYTMILYANHMNSGKSGKTKRYGPYKRRDVKETHFFVMV